MDTNALALPFNLRPMVLNDAPAVAQIEAESYDDAWPLEEFVGWFDYPKGLTAVCVDDTAGGTVAGFVLYERHFKRLHVANVAVAKLYRRRGPRAGLARTLGADRVARHAGLYEFGHRPLVDLRRGRPEKPRRRRQGADRGRPVQRKSE